MAIEPTTMLGTFTWPLSGSGSDGQKTAEKEKESHDAKCYIHIIMNSPAHVGALPDHAPSDPQVRVASPFSEKPTLQL